MPTENGPFRLGIWLQLEPQSELVGEGISHHTTRLIKCLMDRTNVEVVIAVPVWGLAPLEELLEHHDIAPKQIETIVSRSGIPWWLRGWRWLRLSEGLLPWRLKGLRSAAVREWFRRMRSRTAGSLLKLFGLLLSSNILFLVAVLLSLVALVVALPVVLLVRLVVRLIRWIPLLREMRRAVKWARQTVTSGRKLADRKLRIVFTKVREALVEQELRRLAKKARRAKVDVWYVPHPQWSRSELVKRPLVVSLPDFVFADFPSQLKSENLRDYEQTYRRVRRSIRSAARAVCFSEQVRISHAQALFDVNPSRCRVIRHAPTNLNDALLGAAEQWGNNTRLASLVVIRDFLYVLRKEGKTTTPGIDYLERLPFHELPFLFVSSQIRLHKNFGNLLRAHADLVLKRRINLKLVTTGSLARHDDLYDMVVRDGLTYDVVAIPRVPKEVHAALYHLASLTIVPSLFEGGFPFQFAESLSVGTPVLMNAIPPVLEDLPQEAIDKSVFDGYSPIAMADKIEWALSSREELLALQRPHYEAMTRRTWGDVADEYEALFREVTANEDAGL